MTTHPGAWLGVFLTILCVFTIDIVGKRLIYFTHQVFMLNEKVTYVKIIDDL